MPTVTRPVTTDLCNEEQIRTPGSIQPYGLMMVTRAPGFRVIYVAGDIEGRLGVEQFRDVPLHALIGHVISEKVYSLHQSGDAGGFMGQFKTAHNETLDVSAFRSGPYIVVEMERAANGMLPTAIVLDALTEGMENFERATTIISLCKRAAIAFRQLVRFDHVMIYQFLENFDGKVIAEDHRDGIRSLVNHHFPASDIPSQARALYLHNRIRTIPDAAYQPAPLRPDWNEEMPLDLSNSALRSVSPLHLQYLANMGVRASASMSIIKDGGLWGLIACHHKTPRGLTYDIRVACRSLAGSLGRQIKANEEAEGYRQRIRTRSIQDDIVRNMNYDVATEVPLSTQILKLSLMLNADGAVVLQGSNITCTGTCPNEGELRELVLWIQSQSGDTVFSTNNLSKAFTPASAYRAKGSGLLAVTFSTDEPLLLLCFRVDQIQKVIWAGNSHKSMPNGIAPQLTPRASFEAWEKVVQGAAQPWTGHEIDAANRLHTAVLEVWQNRRVAQLNTKLAAILKDKSHLLLQKAFLINEVNYRVQNSLQLVSSFLTLQAQATDSPEVTRQLTEARRRLQAVAHVHQRLYTSDEVETVEIARYLEDLCADTASFMGRDWAQHLAISLMPATVPTGHAVTMGIVLTELIIDCNKYAYGGASGPIEVTLTETDLQLRLIVADRGSGTRSPATGFGSQIIMGLLEQIAAQIAYFNNKPGLRVEITFPISPALHTKYR